MARTKKVGAKRTLAKPNLAIRRGMKINVGGAAGGYDECIRPGHHDFGECDRVRGLINPADKLTLRIRGARNLKK